MSERMIEMQRARLLAGGQQQPQQQAPRSSSLPTQTPAQAAVAHQRQKDARLGEFLARLQCDYDPTVPTALSQRVLHTHGARTSDPAVAAFLSASADRFLATVLRQSIVCRDQRLGEEMESKGVRAKHYEHYRKSQRERAYRKRQREKDRTAYNHEAIKAAAELGTDKKKKASIKRRRPDDGDDEASYDSLDEEEDYYNNHYGKPKAVNSSDDEDEDIEGDTLRLKDVHLPLQAFDFSIEGKLGLESEDESESSDGEEGDEEDEDLDMEEDKKVAFVDARKSPTTAKAASPKSKSRTPTPTINSVADSGK